MSKEKVSTPILVICLAVMLFLSYCIGSHDGNLKGQEAMCEDMGGFLGQNTKTKDVNCFNGTFEQIPSPDNYDFNGEEIKWE
jgi:hypothetical protein